MTLSIINLKDMYGKISLQALLVVWFYGLGFLGGWG